MNAATIAFLAMLETTIITGPCTGYTNLICESKTNSYSMYFAQTDSTAMLNEIASTLNNTGVTKCYYDLYVDEGNWCGSRGFFELEVVQSEVVDFNLLDAWNWVE